MKFHSGERMIRDTYAEISLKTLKQNFQILKKHSAGKSKQTVKICSIVKADAYGHGMNAMAEFLADIGTDYLGTADYDESIILSDHLKRHSKKKVPVICLGLLTEKKFFGDVVSRNVEISLAEVKTARELDRFARSQNKKVTVQIQVDSGINRTGFLMKDAYRAVEEISKLKNLKIKGIYSHFATSEISKDAYAAKQLKNFAELLKDLEANVTKFELRHISNTGGILNYQDRYDGYFNMIRPGVSLYGYYPDRRELVRDIGLMPVMTLRSKIKYIKTLDKGNSISYGRRYFTKKKTMIASLPVGYGDGYRRHLSNKAKVLIKGKLYPVVGTVCMDWIMVDIGMNSGIKVGNEAEIFGKNYPADNLSELMGTIPYEITCGITGRVQRIYTYK